MAHGAHGRALGLRTGRTALGHAEHTARPGGSQIRLPQVRYAGQPMGEALVPLGQVASIQTMGATPSNESP